MLIGGVVAFLFILGLFLSMLSTSPKPQTDPEWRSDTEPVAH
jgi:hypothetical protein